ncbi:MAG: SRPBCC family protein [Gemmatimonadales bacterium]
MSWVHTHSCELTHSPARVFRALTDRTELTSWFAQHAAPGTAPGESFRFWGRHTLGVPTAEEATQRLTRFEADSVVAFTWRLYQTATEVTLTLAPAADGAGTKLTLRHEIQDELGVPRSRELIDDLWRFSLGNLSCHLAGGAGIVLPDYADPAPEVRMVITIEAPPEAVFRALIEPESINRWFGTTSAVVEPRLGGRYDLKWQYKVDGNEVHGGPTTILEFVPNRKLTLDWPDWRGDTSVTGQTITWLLEPTGRGTRVTLVHAGFSRTTDISDYPFGWVYFLDELTKAVTGGIT